jgi:hypothetical protein
MIKNTYSKPADVVAEDGRVLIDGPNGVDVALTPDAARITGERLIMGADDADARQRRREALDRDT